MSGNNQLKCSDVYYRLLSPWRGKVSLHAQLFVVAFFGTAARLWLHPAHHLPAAVTGVELLGIRTDSNASEWRKNETQCAITIQSFSSQSTEILYGKILCAGLQVKAHKHTYLSTGIGGLSRGQGISLKVDRSHELHILNWNEKLITMHCDTCTIPLAEL